MGDSKKYYYLKPKSVGSKTARRVDLIEQQSRPQARGIYLGGGGEVVNMDFDTAVVSSSGLTIWWFVRLFVVVLIALLLYIGGGLIYQGATNIQANITDVTARGVSKLEAAAQAITQRDMQTAKTNFIAAENLFANAQKDILSLGQTNLYLSGLASSDSKIVAGQKLIDSGINLVRAGQLFINTMTPIVQYIDSTSTGQVNVQDFIIRLASLLSDSVPDMDRALARVNKANQLLTSVPPELLDAGYREAVVDAQAKTADLQSLLAAASTFTKELPDVLGMNNPRRYMILNQNDSELRPTGGFMGSVTILELYQGKITDVFVDDAYRIDGQIVGPTSSEKVFPNANFDPDFVATAAKLEDLYEEGGGGSVDGVIAINTQVIGNILTVVGDIYLPTRGITVASANFAQIVHQEIDDEAGTDTPKQVLNELLPVMMDRLMHLSKQQVEQLGAVLMAEIRSKNLLIKSNNRNLQPLIEDINWAGQIHATSADEDFLMVVRANMGARKSSPSIIEEIDHLVNINLSGEATANLQLTYTHVGTDEYPDGTNQEFIRVYVPEGSILQTISGINEDTQVTTEAAHNKTIFAFWVTTEPGQSRQVVINYSLPLSLSGGRYSLYIQKQPGANATRLTSTLKLSPALQMAGSDDQKIKRLYDDRLASDLKLGVDYIQVT